MARYRSRLPQLSGEPFLTDGGIETTLIFHQGFTLPEFASFVLFADPDGRAALDAYFRGYAALAREHGAGFILESATWRANRDWGDKLGYDAASLADVNRRAIGQLLEIRDEFGDGPPMVVSGCVGPRGDGYRLGTMMGADEAADYHAAQIDVFAGTDADMVAAMTMNYAAEAVGIARAAQGAAIPAAISFTVETDGSLPSGQGLAAAIAEVDAATDGYPAYYMINCAHPAHFAALLDGDAPSLARLRGLRANASQKSHAELDESDTLDAGDPDDLGRRYQALRLRHPGINILGGCCGTDLRHLEAICRACLSVPKAARR
ncbi:homocysteine S-methyltransferase family protein [Crenobacter cavernae]|uniref:Homocysteine S-methyltransferase n=1 Tax=Crenobacter cavernae TaxID=2290923 RepID=A0A345Y4U8_9NEIS|nr:homocysteine S-methyltransferase family protein [Crenobacter cavernae]AXK38950.1 homocysteine S-methyltransferase [Crenobacter cavernae]